MPKLLAVLSFLIFAALAGCSQDEVAKIEAIDNAVGELDAAFEAQDAKAVKALMTADHLSVTPYYGTPQSVDEVLASLPELKYAQTDLSEPKVVLLECDSAMRTLTAKIEGSFKGEPFSEKVFITSILTRQDGKWLEQFYQVTKLAP
jgi:ketosteroid isomerase-like protein